MSRFEKVESAARGLAYGFRKSLFQPYLALYNLYEGRPYEGRLRYLFAGPLARGAAAGAIFGGAAIAKSVVSGHIDYDGFNFAEKAAVAFPFFEYIGWFVADGLLGMGLRADATDKSY